MSTRRFAVDDWVVIAEGNFQNFEGQIKTIDPATNLVQIAVSIFGRETLVESPLASLLRFDELPVVWSSPSAADYLADLLELFPSADAAFGTSYRGPHGDHGRLCICRCADSVHGILRWFNMTWPLLARGETRTKTHECRIALSRWTRLQQLVSDLDFWNLPYDDGQRYPPGSERRHDELVGFDHGRCHSVRRYTSKPSHPVRVICEYMNLVYAEARAHS